MYVRALSTESSETVWVQRFVALAGTEPCESLLTLCDFFAVSASVLHGMFILCVLTPGRT